MNYWFATRLQDFINLLLHFTYCRKYDLYLLIYIDISKLYSAIA